MSDCEKTVWLLLVLLALSVFAIILLTQPRRSKRKADTGADGCQVEWVEEKDGLVFDLLVTFADSSKLSGKQARGSLRSWYWYPSGKRVRDDDLCEALCEIWKREEWKRKG